MTSKANRIIEVKNLTAKYGERTILEGITFDVRESEIVVIVGESGCGKSTLLKHIIGLYAPYSGQVLLEGLSRLPGIADSTIRPPFLPILA